MITNRESGLRTIQSLIVHPRHQAYQIGGQSVGELLDDMELLPEMLADEADRGEDFRHALQSIVQKHPSCRYVVESFMNKSAAAGQCFLSTNQQDVSLPMSDYVGLP